MKPKKTLEKFAVEYFDVEAGWIRIKITSGEKAYYNRFSHYWDPLPDLRIWLESITQGAEQCSFTYDNEGQIIKFDFQRTFFNTKNRTRFEYENDLCCFSVYWEDEKRLDFQAIVNKKQLVKAFYCGLINLYDSEEYSPLEWERKPLYENLKYGSNIYGYISKRKQELTEILSDATNDGTKPNDWDIPDDYFDIKNVSFEYRKSILQKLLRINVNPYDGMAKKEFQSEIIENHLGIEQAKYDYSTKKIIDNPLINELSKFRYTDSKNDTPPEWWKAIRQDKELYVEIRKGVDVCFNGCIILKNLTWTEEEGYDALVYFRYLPKANMLEYQKCDFETLPELLPKIKKAILEHFPNSNKEGQKSQWLLRKRNYLVSDFDFENKISFDLIKADVANKRIVFQKFVLADDYINVKDIKYDLQNYSKTITENAEKIRQYLEQIALYKKEIGVLNYFLPTDISKYTIETIPELLISDYIEPYNRTDDKGRRVCKVIEMMESEKIRYSFANINVDGHLYKRQLLQTPLENWIDLFRLISWLEKADKIDPAETYTDHDGTRTRPLRHVEFKSIAVPLISSCSRCNIFVDFDYEKWEIGINAIDNKKFGDLDVVSLCKILTVLLYSKSVNSLGTHCNPNNLEDGNVLKILKEIKQKIFCDD